MSEPFHFDVLPIRLRPMPFESLISFLMRLGEALCFQSTMSLLQFLGIANNISSICYMSPANLENLSVLTQISTSALRIMTFYHVSEKFGLLPNLPTMAKSLSMVLRYCPYCLAEDGFYSFTWLFRELIGCPKHNCYLLDKCSHCGRAIPVIPSKPHIGKCPSCGGNLKDCQSESLGTDLLNPTTIRFQDIGYLLSNELPTFSQNSQLQHRLKQIRQVRSESYTAVSVDIGFRNGVYKLFENGAFDETTYAPSVFNYFRIADHFQTSIKMLCESEDLFNQFLQESKIQLETQRQIKAEARKEYLRRYGEAARARNESVKKRVTALPKSKKEDNRKIREEARARKDAERRRATALAEAKKEDDRKIREEARARKDAERRRANEWAKACRDADRKLAKAKKEAEKQFANELSKAKSDADRKLAKAKKEADKIRKIEAKMREIAREWASESYKMGKTELLWHCKTSIVTIAKYPILVELFFEITGRTKL